MTTAERPGSGIKNMAAVLIVADLAASLEYYRRLGFRCDHWGHAERDGLVLLLRQAKEAADVRPLAGVEVERGHHDAERTYDVYAYPWNEAALDALYAEFVAAGAEIAEEPVECFEEHAGLPGFYWKRWAVRDVDGYVIRFGCLMDR